MAETNDILNQAKKVWTNLGAGQKAAAIGITIVVFGGILAGAFFGSTADYKQLIADVPGKEMSSIISQLDDAGISDYKIVDGGSIHVNSDDYDTARNLLYRSGTLTGSSDEGEGSSILPGSGSLTRDERAHQRTIATAARLGKRIESSLDDVKKADVTITARKNRFFKGGDAPAKATVIITPKGNHHDISRGVVDTIAYLVASGVDSLSVDDVTISTNSGNMLKSAKSGADTGNQEARLAHKAQLEAGKINKVQTMLDKVYGPNQVLVALDVDLDWTRTNSTQKTYDTEGKVVREKTTQETTKPVGTSRNGGAPGNNATNNGQKTEKTAMMKDSTKKESADFGSTSTTEIKMGGTITRMTASVIVNESLAGQKKELEEAVAAAIGLDTDRGDTIKVTSAKMTMSDSKPEETAGPSIMADPKTQYYIDKAIYVVLGLAFVFFALRTIKKAQADLRSVLEASLEEEQKVDPVAPLTLEESVLDTATGDSDLAGRSLRRWLYEGSTVGAGAEK